MHWGRFPRFTPAASWERRSADRRFCGLRRLGAASSVATLIPQNLSTAPAPEIIFLAPWISALIHFLIRSSAHTLWANNEPDAARPSTVSIWIHQSRSASHSKPPIEHGHANHRSDNFYSVAYWYQAEPHAAFRVLPAVPDRLPWLARQRRSRKCYQIKLHPRSAAGNL